MICLGPRHVHLFAKEIIAHKGEGVMLRKVGSTYENGRSLSLLKFKVLSSPSLSLYFIFPFSFSPSVFTLQAQQCDAEGIVTTINSSNDITLKLYGYILLIFFTYSILSYAGNLVFFSQYLLKTFIRLLLPQLEMLSPSRLISNTGLSFFIYLFDFRHILILHSIHLSTQKF